MVKSWSPSLQEQVMHGGRSPVATTGRQSHDPEWRRPTQKVRKESRFEQWDNSCTANTQFHHKPGTGNPHRKTLRSRTKPWAEVQRVLEVHCNEFDRRFGTIGTISMRYQHTIHCRIPIAPETLPGRSVQHRAAADSLGLTSVHRMSMQP